MKTEYKINQDQPVYKVIAKKLYWQPRVEKFIDQRIGDIQYIQNNLLPSGSGFDCGTKIVIEDDQADYDQSYTLTGDYHYMDDMGGYAGWFGFEIKVTASLTNNFYLDFSITYNDTELTNEEIEDYLGDYIYQTYDISLRELCNEFPREEDHVG